MAAARFARATTAAAGSCHALCPSQPRQGSQHHCAIMRPRPPMNTAGVAALAVVTVLSLRVPAAEAVQKGWYAPIPGKAQAIPYFDDPPMIAMEAENFTVAKHTGNDFVAGDWYS